VNKTWSVVLIILACLAVLSGTYWYFAMRTETQTVEQGEPEAIQRLETTVQPSMAPTLEEKTEPAVLVEPMQEEEVIQPIEAVQQQSIEEVPIQMPVMDNIIALPPPIDPLLQSGLLKLPGPSAPSVPIPFAAPQPLVKASAKTETPEEEPVAPQPEEELVLEEEPIVEEQMLQFEEIAPGVEEVVPPIVGESEKVVLTPIAPQTPQIPTNRVQIDPEPLSWTIGTAVSFANFDLPSLNSNGFSLQVDVLKHTDTLFSFGGALEYGRDKSGENQLSVLAKGQWTFREDKAFNIPVSISLGPTFFFGSSSELGLTAKVTGGFSYEIVKNLRFFYQAGIQAQWVITAPDFNLSLEPMHIGFSYSF